LPPLFLQEVPDFHQDMLDALLFGADVAGGRGRDVIFVVHHVLVFFNRFLGMQIIV